MLVSAFGVGHLAEEGAGEGKWGEDLERVDVLVPSLASQGGWHEIA